MVKDLELKPGVEQDNLVRPAFTRKYLDGEKEESSGEVITLRLNAQERALVNQLKRTLNYGQDAKVIKAGLVVLQNVVHGTFGAALMGKMTDPDRRRVIFDDTKDDNGVGNL